MSMTSVNLFKSSRPLVVADGVQAPFVKSIEAPDRDIADEVYVVSLDQLNVIFGVYRREQIRSSDELIAGDEFEFLEQDSQYRTSAFKETGQTSIKISTTGLFEPSSFNATITHSVVFISETGKLLKGFVLDGSGNAADRPSVFLYGEIQAASEYTLIEISEGRKEFDLVDVSDRSATPAQQPRDQPDAGCIAVNSPFSPKLSPKLSNDFNDEPRHVLGARVRTEFIGTPSPISFISPS